MRHVAMLAAMLAILSCEQAPTAPAEIDAEAIATSPEAAAFLAIHDEWAERVNAAGNPELVRSLMHAALKGGDPTALNHLLFGGELGAEAFNTRLAQARTNLFDAYPELASISVSGCEITPEKIDAFFARPITGGGMGAMWSSDDDREDRPTCGSWWNTAKLLTCAGACAVIGGPVVVGGLCAWGCWCMLCSDSYTGDILC